MVQSVSSFSPSLNPATLAALAQVAQAQPTTAQATSPAETSPYGTLPGLLSPPPQDEFTTSSSPSPAPATSDSALPQSASSVLNTPAEPTTSPSTSLPAGFKSASPLVSAGITAAAGLVTLRVVHAIVEGAKDILSKERQWTGGKAFAHLVKGSWPVTLGLAAGLGIADFVVQNKQANNLKSVMGGADIPLPSPSPTVKPLPSTGQSAAQPA